MQNGQVIIVDEFTGRLMPGRRWSEGLHQAVEAKEGVKVNPENITHATITLQNYFRKYEKLAGMTGTAVTEAEELSTIYKLDVIEIPTNLDFEAAKPTTKLTTLQTKDEEGYTYTYYTNQDDPEKDRPVLEAQGLSGCGLPHRRRQTARDRAGDPETARHRPPAAGGHHLH